MKLKHIGLLPFILLLAFGSVGLSAEDTQTATAVAPAPAQNIPMSVPANGNGHGPSNGNGNGSANSNGTAPAQPPFSIWKIFQWPFHFYPDPALHGQTVERLTEQEVSRAREREKEEKVQQESNALAAQQQEDKENKDMRNYESKHYTEVHEGKVPTLITAPGRQASETVSGTELRVNPTRRYLNPNLVISPTRPGDVINDENRYRPPENIQNNAIARVQGDAVNEVRGNNFLNTGSWERPQQVSPQSAFADLRVKSDALARIKNDVESRFGIKLDPSAPYSTVSDLMTATQVALNSKVSPEVRSFVKQLVQEELSRVLEQNITEASRLGDLGLTFKDMNLIMAPIQRDFNIKLPGWSQGRTPDNYTIEEIFNEIRSLRTRNHGTVQGETLSMVLKESIIEGIRARRLYNLMRNLTEDSKLNDLGLLPTAIDRIREKVFEELGLKIKPRNGLISLNINPLSEITTVGNLMGTIQEALILDRKNDPIELSSPVKEAVLNEVQRFVSSSSVEKYLFANFGVRPNDKVILNDLTGKITDRTGNVIPGTVVGVSKNFIYLRDSATTIRQFEVGTLQLTKRIFSAPFNIAGFAALNGKVFIAVDAEGLFTFSEFGGPRADGKRLGASNFEIAGKNRFVHGSLRVSEDGRGVEFREGDKLYKKYLSKDGTAAGTYAQDPRKPSEPVRTLKNEKFPGPIVGSSPNYLYILDSPSTIRQFDLKSRQLGAAIAMGGEVVGFLNFDGLFLVTVQNVGLLTFSESHTAEPLFGESMGNNKFTPWSLQARIGSRQEREGVEWIESMNPYRKNLTPEGFLGRPINIPLSSLSHEETLRYCRVVEAGLSTHHKITGEGRTNWELRNNNLDQQRYNENPIPHEPWPDTN